jgi:hypothetical protein
MVQETKLSDGRFRCWTNEGAIEIDFPTRHLVVITYTGLAEWPPRPRAPSV